MVNRENAMQKKATENNKRRFDFDNDIESPLKNPNLIKKGPIKFPDEAVYEGEWNA